MTCSSFYYFVTFRLCEEACSLLGMNLEKKETISAPAPFNPQIRKHVILKLKKADLLDECDMDTLFCQPENKDAIKHL